MTAAARSSRPRDAGEAVVSRELGQRHAGHLAQLPAGVIVLRPSMIKVVGRAATGSRRSGSHLRRRASPSAARCWCRCSSTAAFPETLLHACARPTSSRPRCAGARCGEANDVDRALAPLPVAVVLRAIDKPGRRRSVWTTGAAICVCRYGNRGRRRGAAARGGSKGGRIPEGGFTESDARVSRSQAIVELKGGKVATSPTGATPENVIRDPSRGGRA